MTSSLGPHANNNVTAAAWKLQYPQHTLYTVNTLSYHTQAFLAQSPSTIFWDSLLVNNENVRTYPYTWKVFVANSAIPTFLLLARQFVKPGYKVKF
jgi:hypothetical protein